jgi:SAM-dependent methyltransferase
MGSIDLNREHFDRLYRGEPSVADTGIPWDIHAAQPYVMEIDALGGISGEVLDIGCGLGDNAIYLASRGHSVTGLDGSSAAIEQARTRAAEAGVAATFGVIDATNITGYDGRFDTVVDSALYHCLDSDGQKAYTACLHRATKPGARWYLHCFSDGYVNGVLSPLRAIPVSNIRETLAANGWRVDYLGPTTNTANAAAFNRGWDDLSEHVRARFTPEALAQIRDLNRRLVSLAEVINDHRVYLPFTKVHATRID